MANMCVYEPINGSYPDCDGACRKGKDNYCKYYVVDEICELLSKWKKEAKVEEPILIKYDYKRKKMIIYTTKPGYLIGFHGKTIEKYSEPINKKLRLRFTDANGMPQGENFIEFIECNDVLV